MQEHVDFLGYDVKKMFPYTVRPKTPSDLIPWAQKIENGQILHFRRKNGGIIRPKGIFFETFWANSSGGFKGLETFFF